MAIWKHDAEKFNPFKIFLKAIKYLTRSLFRERNVLTALKFHSSVILSVHKEGVS